LVNAFQMRLIVAASQQSQIDSMRPSLIGRIGHSEHFALHSSVSIAMSVCPLLSAMPTCTSHVQLIRYGLDVSLIKVVCS